MSGSRPITLLHLSDLQFGKYHRFDRPGSGQTGDTLLLRLQDDLDRLRQSPELADLHFDLLILTGDLAEQGLPSEFEQVYAFADRMAGLVGLPRDRVVLVPGNHDVNRRACAAYFNECEADERQPEPPYFPKLRHFAALFQKFYAGVPGVQFTAEEPWTLFEIPALQVVVAGLDSTIAESHRDGDHYGWVGEPQLRWFAGRLREYREKGWLRLGAVHHNVLRRATADDENLRDADDLRRILGPFLNLVLHGHTHEGRALYLSPRLPVLSTGSTGVGSAARPLEVPNQYQVIRLWADRLGYGTRAYAPDQKRWVGDTRVSVDGNAWIAEERIEFEAVQGTFSEGKSAALGAGDQLAALVQSYRKHVVATCRFQTYQDLSLRAEDTDLPSSLELLDIFVPQSLRLAPPPRDVPRLPEGLQTHDDSTLPLAWLNAPERSIEEVAVDPAQPWILLLGAPGAGKTAFTRWLCLKLCADGESLPGLPADAVPVRLEMRRFDRRYQAALTVGRAYDFFDYLEQEHIEHTLALRGDHLRSLAQAGRLLWIFDGMDEVPEVPSRRRYAEMIGALIRAHPARGVITSRIVGARPFLPFLQSCGVAAYTILDFDDERVREFLLRWHDHAFPTNPEVAYRRRERMHKAIHASRAVRDLCGNPLLLTLVALLNRGGELPRRRHLLYRRAVELTASQWEANKQLPPGTTGLEFEDKVLFLRRLAWHMQFELATGSSNLIEEEELTAFAIRFFKEQFGRSDDAARRSAEQLIHHLRDRNYVLALLGGRHFGFVHRTFLEYLTAEAVRSAFAGRTIDVAWIAELFRDRWDQDEWQEILLLICGLLAEDRPETVLEIIQRVLPTVPIAQPASLFFVEFCEEWLGEAKRLSPALREGAIGLLKKLHDHDWNAAERKGFAVSEVPGEVGKVSRLPQAGVDLLPPTDHGDDLLADARSLVHRLHSARQAEDSVDELRRTLDEGRAAAREQLETLLRAKATASRRLRPSIRTAIQRLWESGDEEVRLRAAFEMTPDLGFGFTERRRAIRMVGEAADDQHVRLWAAEALGAEAEATLLGLASWVEDPALRAHAVADLQSLALREELSQLGVGSGEQAAPGG